MKYIIHKSSGWIREKTIIALNINLIAASGSLSFSSFGTIAGMVVSSSSSTTPLPPPPHTTVLLPSNLTDFLRQVHTLANHPHTTDPLKTFSPISLASSSSHAREQKVQLFEFVCVIMYENMCECVYTSVTYEWDRTSSPYYTQEKSPPAMK